MNKAKASVFLTLALLFAQSVFAGTFTPRYPEDGVLIVNTSGHVVGQFQAIDKVSVNGGDMKLTIIGSRRAYTLHFSSASAVRQIEYVLRNGANGKEVEFRLKPSKANQTEFRADEFSVDMV